jgi:flagellar M-ring protein FliF
VKIINIDITLDMGKKTVETEEHFPITMVEDDPSTPYSEAKVIESITISKNSLDEKFKGTGFNPEGPPGQEGQTPPAYKDLEGLVGEYSKESQTQNEVVNTRNIYEERSPWNIARITAAVAIDGIWKRQYDENGEVIVEKDGSIKREYIPVTEEELEKAQTLVEHAIGYKEERGDSVTVQHIQFDRTEQFAKEDEKYRARMRTKQMLLYGAIGLAAILVAFVAFRLISREVERRRKLREEELARQHQAMREAALRSAEEEGVEVEMSVEERARMEMQENAINMAREHPEDVAQLIRTWLMEE